LFTLIKKDFQSELFNQTIKKDAENYDALVKAELLFRIKNLERANCSCYECADKFKEYIKYYEKLDPPKSKLVI